MPAPLGQLRFFLCLRCPCSVLSTSLPPRRREASDAKACRPGRGLSCSHGWHPSPWGASRGRARAVRYGVRAPGVCALLPHRKRSSHWASAPSPWSTSDSTLWRQPVGHPLCSWKSMTVLLQGTDKQSHAPTCCLWWRSSRQTPQRVTVFAQTPWPWPAPSISGCDVDKDT